MKGYNSLLGSHYDHYYIDYNDYCVDEIDPNVFEVDSSKYIILFRRISLNKFKKKYYLKNL